MASNELWLLTILVKYLLEQFVVSWLQKSSCDLLVHLNLLLRKDVISLDFIVCLVHVQNRKWPRLKGYLDKGIVATDVQVQQLLENALVACLVYPFLPVFALFLFLVVVDLLQKLVYFDEVLLGLFFV